MLTMRAESGSYGTNQQDFLSDINLPFERPASAKAQSLIEADLRILTAHYLSAEPHGVDLQILPYRSTALAQECYARLMSNPTICLLTRARFYQMAARALRHILVEKASHHGAYDLVVVHNSLCLLERVHPRKAQVAELRYFGGLSCREIAETLDISEISAQRTWMTARRWLHRRAAKT